MNGWSNPGFRAHPARRAGFTLVELLAVIAVVGLLAALALPALAGSKGRTKIGQCAVNLKQFALAMQIYAGENNDQLPPSNAGNWAWDLPWDSGTAIARYGATREVLYCPGTGPRFADADNNALYNYVPGSFRLIGYVTTFPGTASLITTNINRLIVTEPISVGLVKLPAPLPSVRVLFADATISAPGQTDPSLRYSYNYTAVQGGYVKQHLSPHLSGKFPAGGNLAMLDGHVEWRAFSQMAPRTTAGAGTPAFWW